MITNGDDASEEGEQKRDFVPREYQTELLDIAIRQNTIVFLPTGSGKTFIATLLIKALGKSIEPSYSKGGKRTFFLVNAVALVGQQAKSLRDHTPFEVGEYSGDTGVDYWDIKKWEEELEQNQVLVMTVQILLDMLQHKYIGLHRINLLILDECHHATNNHPMKMVMDLYKIMATGQQKPRVLGLTATLLNGNCSPERVRHEKSQLEHTLDAKIAFTNNRELIQKFSTNPKEDIIKYSEYNDPMGAITDMVYELLRNQFSRWAQNFEHVLFLSDLEDISEPLANGAVRYSTKPTSRKKIKAALNLVQKICIDLGIYGASKALLSTIITFERVKLSHDDNSFVLMLAALITELHRLRGIIDKIMTEHCASEDFVIHFATPKLKKLFDIIKKQTPTDLSIVFVEFRLTAKVLYYMLSDLAAQNKNFSHVRPDFITGFANNPYKPSRESLFEKKHNMQTLYRFNESHTNILVASDVIEEGIDIRMCNYVIKFDLPKNVRSYIQSKGRARHKSSQYLVFVSESDKKFLTSYETFVKVEDELKNALKFKDFKTEPISNCSDELGKYLPYDPYPPDGAQLLPISAIALLNRYCSSLPQDSFSRLTVEWYKKDLDNGMCQIFLKLPLDSCVKELIKSPECRSVLAAKHLAAFQACILLHKAGELDMRLLPRGAESCHLDDSDLFPNWRQTDHKSSGTKKSKRRYDKEVPSPLMNCLPIEGSQVYVHLLMMKPNFSEPIDCTRDMAFYRTLKSDRHFAILSSKPLPPICSFPLFLRIGEVTVDVKANFMQLNLYDNLLILLSEFHNFIFDKLLHMNSGKQFLLRDNENKEHSYLIAPCIFDEKKDELTIDWEVVHDEKNLLVPVAMPTDITLGVTNESHLLKVVEPWYRSNMSDNLRYIVTEVCFDESPMTAFPSHNYDSYYAYYENRHKQTVRDKNQPLIEVRAISNKLNYLNPRCIPGASKKRSMDHEIYNEKFIPELCVVHNIPAAYALKSTLLPSLLHRVTQLLVAEELRRQIALETELQLVELSEGKSWQPLTVEKTSLSVDDESTLSTQSTIDVTNLLKSRMDALTVSGYPWAPQDEPLDIEREHDRVDMLTIFHYESFLRTPVVNEFSKFKAEKRLKKELIDPPPLKVLQHKTDPLLPELRDVLTALTTKSAADIVNYERLETLGDSFLKFAVSLALFTAFPKEDEGKLTSIKGKIIGNRNLFYCGDTKAKLGMKIKANEFNTNDWDLPRFTIPRPLKTLITDLRVSPSILYELRTTDEERRSGILKNSTITEFRKKLDDIIESPDDNGSASDLIGQQTVADKVVADGVEALLGVYVLAHGFEGGLRLCRWFGILPPWLANSQFLISQPTPSPLFDPNVNPNDYITEPDELEYILGYKFNDRGFLLQALTHSSFTGGVTNCYQRLEFLGDAVLDFLITNYIFESCGNLTPGELTDLRSALVNNVTFACLAVRSRFHVFLNSRTCKLNEIISKFVEHQEMRKHAVGPEILFLLEEKEVEVAAIVDAPKCLGDLFESLAGAIYLDSGKDLRVVWKVFYNLMRCEITQFSQNVPKNMIRLLYEKFPNPRPKFLRSEVIPNDKRVMVGVEVYHNEKTHSFFGVGNNKHEAKLAAAKLALRKFHSEESITKSP